MDNSFFMCLSDIFREQVFVCVIPAPLPGDVIPLYRENRWVLVAVFLFYLLIFYRYSAVIISGHFDNSLDFLIKVCLRAPVGVAVAVIPVKVIHAFFPHVEDTLQDLILDFFHGKCPC